MELTWGSAENEGKDKNSWPKEMAALSLMDRCNKRRQFISKCQSITSNTDPTNMFWIFRPGRLYHIIYY